ncbi:MAG: MBL fold metallo-hydrolase [Candidatus Margulisbacteria bacterium]|nr:MBL fold metallo-hydrolase [Candidatus Margulisiibacteriota bacterium]
MEIKTIKVGSLQTNCYVIVDEESNEAVVLDPGDESAKIVPEIKNIKVRFIILTHGHPDHFGALDKLKEVTGAPLLFNVQDSWFAKPDQDLHEGDEVKFGSIVLKVLHTPGHSQGSICLFLPAGRHGTKGHLFSGDTLFSTTWGRTDLPGGSPAEMRKSLSRLALLPDETIVYPGHDETTTIGQEKERGTLA